MLSFADKHLAVQRVLWFEWSWFVGLSTGVQPLLVKQFIDKQCVPQPQSEISSPIESYLAPTCKNTC